VIVDALGPEADQTIEEVRQLLGDQNVIFSLGSLPRFINRHAITRKKDRPRERSKIAPTLD
jgi:hypothetical protein